MRSLLWMILFPVFFSCCGGGLDFIPGTYVCASRSAFGVAQDTLMITLENGLHYRLERRVGYAAIRDGKVLPGKFKREVSELVFDPAKLVLTEPLSGRVFRFDRERGVLLLNMAAFRRL